MELLAYYIAIGIVWMVYCVSMAQMVSDDERSSRMLTRGFWLTPIWPVVILGLGAYGLHYMWQKAEWGK